MGTDAGAGTSEKAHIGGRTSLTQLDTWLETMDGETLCLTGKVTDCWQPVDGAQENASFYLKDLSIEADASSFVFSGDSAEMTDNLSQISGSADADQMSVLISSQKTTSQINEMQEIFGKNASVLCYLQEDEALPKAGSYVRVFGEVSPFLQATNPGEFDTAAYYRRKDCLFALRKTKITAQTKNYGRLEEFLSQLRYESEVLFRKLLGEKNGATASAMVLGRKKGMDSEVKALYQGAGISHLLAISGLHLSLIGAGLFGLLKKVRLPVALSAGISTWILIVYAQLTGMGISTRRALVMFLLFLAAGLLKRTPDLPTSLAVAALLLLVPKPQRILDAGFQLSFSAVLGIAVMIPVLQDGWEDAAPSLRVTDGVAGWNIARAAVVRVCRLLRKNILAGLGITMTMLPFLLIHFYEWSPWSVLLNLAVIPLMGILLPCLIGLQLVARLTALVHCLELPQHLLCAAIEAIFFCYEQLCRFTTALPGSILHTGYPTWQALAVYTIGLIALAVSGKKLRPHLRLAVAVCLMGIFLIRLPGELNVTMLDVGQGECVGIETREHHVYLVDAGSTSKKNQYIDIHCHILPEVDDGARNLEESLTMLRQEVKQGAAAVILTPHQKPNRRSITAASALERTQTLQRAAKENGIDIRLYSGGEIFCCMDTIELLKQGKAGTLAGSDYILTEFSPDEEWAYIRNCLYDLLCEGYRPIVAHTERYRNVVKDFNRVEELKDMGCRIQINAGELPGLLGGQLKRTARSLIKEELADLIGTDAHRAEGERSVSMAEGALWLQRHCSPEYAARLLYKNAAHILDNTDMEDIE